MGALFLDAVVGEDQNHRGVFDGGQAVGNRQGGAAFGQGVKALADQNFTLICLLYTSDAADE